MSNRLQRWGERALGQVQSVSPRVSSRFEPEAGASALDEQEGFREVEIETPARRPPAQAAPWRPPEMIRRPPAPSKPPEDAPEPPRVSAQAIPASATVHLPTPSSPRSEPVKLHERVIEPVSRHEETKRLEPSKSASEQHQQPPNPKPAQAPEISEPSVLRLKRFEDWMAAPPREQPSAPEPLEPLEPAPTSFPVPKRTALSASPPTRLPSTLRAEPPPTAPPPPPVVVNIGTIIVRANSAAAPKPVSPPPAAGLAAFLARRTAGEP